MEKKRTVNELVAASKNGDGAAFEELSERYAGMIASRISSFATSLAPEGGSSSFSAEDLRQEAQIALLRATRTYDADGKGKKVTFGLYARICVTNALISLLRKHKSEVRRAKENDAVYGETYGAEDPAYSAAEMRDLMRHAEGVLSRYELSVFREYVGGYRVREIAKDLGRSERSVSNAIYRIKATRKRNAGK